MAATAITAPRGQVASGVGAALRGNASSEATAPAAPSTTASSKLRLAKFAPVNNPDQPRGRARRIVVMAPEERWRQQRSKDQALIVGQPVVVLDVVMIRFTVPVPGLGSHCLDTRQSTANQQYAQDQNDDPPLHRSIPPPRPALAIIAVAGTTPPGRRKCVAVASCLPDGVTLPRVYKAYAKHKYIQSGNNPRE